METKFQTSFIPKKPTASAIGNMSSVTGMSSGPGHAKHSIGPSLFMTLASIIFIVSLLASGGVYGWKYFLVNQLASLKTELVARQQEFGITEIENLKKASVKIDLSRQLLNNHLAMSEIFTIISRFTTETTRFTSLDLSVPDKGATGVKLSLQGYGANLPALAFQSDVLNRLDQLGLSLVVKNPIISEPTINANGVVSFGLTAIVDPNPNLMYEKLLNPVVSTSTATSSAPGNGGVPQDVLPPAGGLVNPFLNQ